MTSSKVPLSLWEQIFMFAALVKMMVVGFIGGAITAPFVSKRHGATLKSYTSRLSARTLFSSLTLRQQKAVMAMQGGEVAYKAACAKRLAREQSADLPMGAKGFWLGELEPSSQNQAVIIWFPGGGYVVDVTLGHFKYLFDQIKALKETHGKSVAVLVVAYTLSPEQVYPYQIKQSIEVVRHVAEELNIGPSRLILAGDSAGAVLALDAMVHSRRCFPDTASYGFNIPFKGLFLMSPWADYDIDKYASYKAHSSYDIATADTFKSWSDAYLAGSPTDNWNAPAQADQQWWEDTLDVKNILITGGADECLVDTITTLGKKIKAAYPNETILVIGEGECHVAPIYAHNSQDLRPFETETASKSWLMTLV